MPRIPASLRSDRVYNNRTVLVFIQSYLDRILREEICLSAAPEDIRHEHGPDAEPCDVDFADVVALVKTLDRAFVPPEALRLLN
jgi:hypothetical protein